MSFVSRSLHAPLKGPSLVKVSWFCKFGGPTTSGSAKTQNHRSRVAGHALITDQSKRSAFHSVCVRVSVCVSVCPV